VFPVTKAVFEYIPILLQNRIYHNFDQVQVYDWISFRSSIVLIHASSR
jgi:hypothetical protein